MPTAVLPAEMSLEEFSNRPEREDGLKEELIEGELVVRPAPDFKYSFVLETLREMLRPLRSRGFFPRE